MLLLLLLESLHAMSLFILQFNKKTITVKEDWMSCNSKII